MISKGYGLFPQRNGQFPLAHEENATEDKGRNHSDTFTNKSYPRLMENHQKLEKHRQKESVKERNQSGHTLTFDTPSLTA